MGILEIYLARLAMAGTTSAVFRPFHLAQNSATAHFVRPSP
jgi:hypothetical protein